MDEDSDSQAEVLRFLGSRETHAGHEVRRIDTHASIVFLAGDRAYKIKRAARFSFMDLSTLERRRAACEAEVAINRANAPDLYLGVVAITRDGDALRFDGGGVVVEGGWGHPWHHGWRGGWHGDWQGRAHGGWHGGRAGGWHGGSHGGRGGGHSAPGGQHR